LIGGDHLSVNLFIFNVLIAMEHELQKLKLGSIYVFRVSQLDPTATIPQRSDGNLDAVNLTAIA
jgi:hypothetical protein